MCIEFFSPSRNPNSCDSLFTTPANLILNGIFYSLATTAIALVSALALKLLGYGSAAGKIAKYVPIAAGAIGLACVTAGVAFLAILIYAFKDYHVKK